MDEEILRLEEERDQAIAALKEWEREASDKLEETEMEHATQIRAMEAKIDVMKKEIEEWSHERVTCEVKKVQSEMQ